MASNMLCARWSNQGVNLWAVDLVTTPLVTGTATYPVDGNTVMILDAYVQNDDSGANIDRIILPVSRTEYASYPNKEQQGFPTVYWFDRLISASRSTGSAGPTVTLWPVPNTDNGPQYLKYYRVRQIQDSALTNGQTVEIPYLWLEAFAYGLAMRLAQIWNPAAVAMIKPMADRVLSDCRRSERGTICYIYLAYDLWLLPIGGIDGLCIQIRPRQDRCPQPASICDL